MKEPLPVSMSIGASFYPDNGHDVDSLLNSADKAMYTRKRVTPGER
jgi:GGDEF domain-containing protein